MQSAVDAAFLVDAVVIIRTSIIPTGFEFLQRDLIRRISVNFIGTEQNKNRFRTMESRNFQKIYGTQGIYLKIQDGNLSRLVVRRLRRTVNYQIRSMGAKEFFECNPVTNVHIVVGEMFGATAKALEIPGCIARISEEDTAHIVVHANDFATLAVKMLHSFRAN